MLNLTDLKQLWARTYTPYCLGAVLNLTDLKQDYVSIYYNAGLRAVVNTTSQNLTRELATPESGAKQLGSKTPKHFGKIFTLTLSTGKTKRTSK